MAQIHTRTIKKPNGTCDILFFSFFFIWTLHYYSKYSENINGHKWLASKRKKKQSANVFL